MHPRRLTVRTGPLRTIGDLETITADWVHWYDTSRLMHRRDRRPPAEAEADYYAQTRDDQPVVHT
jgi:putative transposase